MSELLSKLEQIVGPNGLITGDDVQSRPADWTGQLICTAEAIVRPATAEELSAVLRLCNECEQPVVAAGGLTGLVKGAAASKEELLISFERMTEIEGIDPIGRTMTVQAGAPLQKVQEAAAEKDLLYAVDLGARGSATIGGNISTNAGGNQVIRYGMTRAHVLGVEAVLADGTILSSMNSLLKNNAGYDLKQLFIGSEGTLGLVTRAVLQLAPLPKSENTAFVGLKDFTSVTDFFQFAGARLGGALTAFEVLWKEHYQLIAIDSKRHTPPLGADHEFYVVIESTGADEEHDDIAFAAALEDTIEKEIVSDAVIASSKAQRNAIWAIREDIEALLGALFPCAVFDVSLPIKEMQTYTENLKTAIKSEWGDAARIIIFGHLGDGNLHIAISVRPWSDETHAQVEELVYEPLAKIGGSISAEHGVGLEKRAYLHLSRRPEEIALMRTLKSTLDPKGILNPGKIFTV